jgi:hypothetical protein
MFNFFLADIWLASIDTYGPMSIFCPFYAVMILASLFSDKLASLLQTQRRPVRFLPLSPVYIYAFMPSRIWHALFTGYIFFNTFPTALLL